MRDIYRLLLTTLAGLLALWLVLGFWSLSVSSRVALCLLIVLIVLISGITLWRKWRVLQRRHRAVDDIIDDSLPPEDFQGTVILACGDSQMLFGPATRYRATRQGWYLQVIDEEQLLLLVQRLSLVRPAQIPQIAVLLARVPEQHHCLDDFTQSLRSWQRSVVQCQPWLGALPPVWTVTWISPPSACLQEEAVWFTAVSHLSGIQVHQLGQRSLQLTDWVSENDVSERFSRLSQTLWLNSLLCWQEKTVNSLLAERHGELPALRPCAQGFCMVPVSGRPDNLWQQHIASVTALAPENTVSSNLLPLPELLLSSLPRRRGISRRMRFWLHVGLICGGFLALAMLASFFNNQRLIRSVGDHLTFYHRLSGESSVPKLQAQQHLRTDGLLLNEWQRRGEPLRYRLGLYQGMRLIPPIEIAISSWAPLVPHAPVISRVIQGPQTLRLDSLSLFDSGKSELKTGSVKMLVNSLVGIKAQLGWLIVVSGHTDNTGNPIVNQRLSRARAESVRDWMRDTGDVPESCFAVQGYGADRPVATNDTQEGRALNRRVEIRLVPEADACQLPDTKTASPDESDASTQKMEK